MPLTNTRTNNGLVNDNKKNAETPVCSMKPIVLKCNHLFLGAACALDD